jgi:hypothetical protein
VQGTIRLNSYMFPDSALAERPVQIESPEPEPDRRGRNDRNEGRGRDSRDEEPPRREEPPPDSEEATEAALTEASLRVDPEALAAAASLRPPISNGGGTTGTVALSALFQDPTVLLGVVESVPEKYHDLLDPSLRRVLSRRGHSQAELESAVNELSAEVKAGAQDIGPMIEALRAIPLEEVDRHQHPDFYGNLVRLFRRIP